MIVYHKNNEIDRLQWDNCIKNIPGVKPYPYSWYLDIMAPGWEALVDDDYDSVFPIPNYTRFGFQYVATPAFLQQLGAFSPDKPSSESIKEFLEFMPDFYKHIDLCIGQKIQLNGFKVTEMANYELDLSKSYEKIWENFLPHCKKAIEASAKKKPELVTDITPDEIIDMIIMDSLKKIRGIRIRDFQRLKILMNFCLKNKKGRLIGVRTTRKRLIFGLFIIETHGNKTLGLMLNTQESITKRISYFIINELIRTYSSTRTILDFAGISVPMVDSFKESFGCVNVPYYRIYRNRLFWPVRKMKF
jgi:Trp operon repressor